MTDLNRRLRDADPVRLEPGLPLDTVAEMRRAVIVAAHSAPRRSFLESRQLALAACLGLAVVTGVVVAHRVPSAPAGDAAGALTSPEPDQRTQVQFSTPGGTRIVWTIDPGFQLRETRR
jgi:hypothetical protein